jgi:hypothetical protein
MKSFILALVLTFAFTLSANSFAQDKEKTQTTTTTNTTSTVTKDGKTKNITKKMSKTSKKECTMKGGCCKDGSNKECKDMPKKDTK